MYGQQYFNKIIQKFWKISYLPIGARKTFKIKMFRHRRWKKKNYKNKKYVCKKKLFYSKKKITNVTFGVENDT